MADGVVPTRTRWLLARSRRKAHRRRERLIYERAGAVRAWGAVAGHVLDPWQMRVLVASIREGERSHG